MPADAASVVLRAQAAVLSRDSLADAATALAVELAQALRCTRVSVGLLDGRTLEVVATSGGAAPDARLGAAAAIGAAMHEALDQSATLSYPHTGGAMPPLLMSHQVLAGLTGAACTVPMKGTAAGVSGQNTQASVIGAVTFERPSPAFDPGELALCEDAASFAGPVLELKRDAALPWWRRAGRAIRQRWQAQGRSGMRLAAAAAVVAVLVVLLLPVSYSVSAPARLEGSVQRAIVAAADGFLRQANVRAGDTVKEGQVLAEMASEDLQLERRRRETEMAQHENAYRAAQARNDRAQMVISQSKMGEAQAMLALADSQIARASIQAPFDGIVIKGDLTQTLGAPVQRGEVLLTLAPNDSFRLIVEVDESDIAAIQPGQAGHLALAAVPERALRFTVKRIVPVAASGDARNYFEVEAALDAPTALKGPNLRPGLSGVARIEAGDRTLWWQLTHRIFNWLRLSLWSVGL